MSNNNGVKVYASKEYVQEYVESNVPTKTSDLTNDSGFVTELSDIDLSNYATIDDLNTKADKDNLVATNSISMGRKNNSTIGEGSCAIGNNCTASGTASHAEGLSTNATGQSSHAEGQVTTASGMASHAEGLSTKATSSYSHAENWGTTASGTASHAEGLNTTASGKYSHSEGSETIAKKNYSHAEGSSTIASSDAQHVQGKYNVEDSDNKYAHIVGNGTISARSNAHTLDWNGVGWFAGDLYTGGTGQDDTNAKKIATEEFVNNLISFNDAGELVVTIDGVTKVFVPKEATTLTVDESTGILKVGTATTSTE